MEQFTVHQVLHHYGDVRVILAGAGDGRRFVGLPADGGPAGSVLLVEINQATVLELVRGEVSLYTILTERAIGLVFETANFAGIATAGAPHN